MGNGSGGKALGGMGARGLWVPRTAAAAKRFSTAESAQPCFARARRVLLFAKTPACPLAPCGAGEARSGVGIFSFLPLFFGLNGQLHASKKKFFCGDQSAGLGPLDWASILGRGSRAPGWPEGVRGEGERWAVQPSVKSRRRCQAGASRPSPRISFPCLRAGLLSPCDSYSLVPAE